MISWRLGMRILPAPLILLFLYAISGAQSGQPVPAHSGQHEPASPVRYPNELPTYKLYDEGNWKAIEPFVSTAVDVRKWLGEPSPVRIPYSADWDVIAFYFDAGVVGDKRWGKSLKGTVVNINFYPRHRVSFRQIVFPKTFECGDVYAAHGDDQVKCSDGSGLAYVTYKKSSADGSIEAGDLAYIEYGASTALLDKLHALP